MNELLENLAKALRGTDGGSKVIAAIVGLAVIAAVAVVAVVAQEPHYDLLWENLDEQERAKAGKALAEAGIPFEASSSPGPYNIYVDESDRSRALAAAYQGGAFDKPLRGIVPNDGITAFMSAAERDAHLEKALWQDMEAMLETLDYVRSANVMRPKRRSSTLISNEGQPDMASVTLSIAGGRMLSDEQAETVARMVQTGLGVDAEHLTISDHLGHTIFDGRERLEESLVDKELLEHQEDYDRTRSQRINELLAGMLGPDKARVEITSEWDWEQSAEQLTEAVGKGALLKTEKSTSTTPVPPVSVGGAAGLSSQTQTGTFGTQNASAPLQPDPASSLDETSTYAPTTRTTHRVRTQPELKRLSIVGVIDASVVTSEEGVVDAELVADLEDTIRAATGYSEARQDTFHVSTRTSFFQPEESEEGEGEGEEEASGPNPMLSMLMRRGVEIVTALAFVIFLLKSLKASKSSGSTTAEGVATIGPDGKPAPEEPEEEIDPETLARAQIEELLSSDPQKVGTILGKWAREEGAA